MANRIDTVGGRNKLAPRREPYWHRLGKGLYVGFRKMTNTSNGTWLTRYPGPQNLEIQSSLGTFEQHSPHERFDKAVETTRALLSRSKSSSEDPPQSSITVMDACDLYRKHIQEIKGFGPAEDLAKRYNRWVKPDPIHRIELQRLTREQCVAFRRRIMSTPVKVGKSGTTRERSKDTVNRDIAAVRAAFNKAFDDGQVSTDFAWRQPLKSFKNVSKRRNLYLDREQRRTFIAHAADELANFLRGLSLLPLRPGALAALTVADFDSRLNVLRVGIDKSGQDRRVKLPLATATLLKKLAQDRDPACPLISRADGQAWNKDAWKGPIKDAAINAGLPTKTSALTLRHSVITDLVHGGLDLLTVAQISGTSVAMIEKHYGHLRGNVATSALAKLAL